MAPEVGSCPICLDTLKTPAALTCGHVFCLRCIEHHHAAASRRPSCPSCRAPTREKAPIKLFFSPHDEAPKQSEPRQKTWAEATIPTPLFAEFHLRNLREDLSATQVKYEMTQRQLDSALIEKRSLYSQNRRIISERDNAVRERDSLLRERQMYLREKDSLVSAGLQLETTVAALQTEMSGLRDELRASAAIGKLQNEKRAPEGGNKAEALAREFPNTKVDTSKTSRDPAPSQATEGPCSESRTNSTPPTAGGKDLSSTHVKTPSGVTSARGPSPLPASMSLDEILAGGLRKYMPNHSRNSVYHA